MREQKWRRERSQDAAKRREKVMHYRRGGWGGEEDIRTRKEKIKLEGRRAEESVLQYKLERATQL